MESPSYQEFYRKFIRDETVKESYETDFFNKSFEEQLNPFAPMAAPAREEYDLESELNLIDLAEPESALRNLDAEVEALDCSQLDVDFEIMDPLLESVSIDSGHDEPQIDESQIYFDQNELEGFAVFLNIDWTRN
jgi:hypothetical protein